MDDVQSQEHVIKADKLVRTIIVVAWIVCVILGVVMVKWVVPWGQDRLEKAEPAKALRIMQVVIAFIFLSTLPFSACLYWLGRRAVVYRQMPPPGTRVIKNTRLLEGDNAVKRGRLIMGIAVVLLAVALAGGLYMPYKLGKVFGEKAGRASPDTTQPAP